jgi:precorrin-6B methylase 2
MKKNEEGNRDKELYRQLRALSCDQLWEEIARFDRAPPEERIETVGLVRAVGVVFSEKGTEQQKDQVRPWLRSLLHDASEKIRRYAMTALPKIGAGVGEEEELLDLLRTTTVEREKKFLGQTLEKIGGAATLAQIEGTRGLGVRTEQKVRASVARSESPSTVRMDGVLADFAGLRIHLRGRAGLENIVREEVEEAIAARGKFRIDEVRSGLVAITPVAPFSLADIYALRCFGTVGFVLGAVGRLEEEASIDALAGVITSPRARGLFEAFTAGSIRYRLDFVDKGHQRGAVRLVANRAYALCPDILNDARVAPWSVAIHSVEHGTAVELTPRLVPDPRFSYRQKDVPAASHPPLAACMARLGGRMENEIAWDPFCGSGLELIERALLGGVRQIHGTDRSAEAVAITRGNFEAAKISSVQARFVCCDFRDYGKVEGLRENAATLIVTNPPMGKRVPIPNLHGLIMDLFSVAAKVLRPGGRLVFANPICVENPHRALQLQSRQVIDLGGFDCRLECYRKIE